MAIETFYEAIGRLLSRERMKSLGRFLDMSGVDVMPEAFAGFVAVSCILVSLLVTLMEIAQFKDIYLFFGGIIRSIVSVEFFIAQPAISAVLILVSMFLVNLVVVSTIIVVMAYVVLVLRADARSKHVDEVLPDFLTLAAANVRAGMSIDQAMWHAAKPEFGIFSKEVELVAKRAFGGEPFNHALDRLAVRFNSRSVRRAVALIKQGLASGGEMAEILERTAEDSREMQLINKEISASLLMYVMFIFIAAGAGTPFMFSVANRLLYKLEDVFSRLPSAESLPSGGFNFVLPSPPGITSGDFFIFSLFTMCLTGIFAALIVGVIQAGSKKEGIKYMPIMLAITLVIFFIIGWFLEMYLPA